MKNDNLFWGVKRIQGELLKLGIALDSTTIWKIIRELKDTAVLLRNPSSRKVYNRVRLLTNHGAHSVDCARLRVQKTR
jgi:hypothetical protein